VAGRRAFLRAPEQAASASYPTEATTKMLKLTHWCIHHRRSVFLAWVVIAIGTTAVATAVGRQYATNFTLPGTETQRAFDLLNRDFKSQSGDVDTIVYHVSNGTVQSPQVKPAIESLLRRVALAPHVVGVISPYTPRGAVQISPDRRTAFATINFSKRASELPNSTGTVLLQDIAAVHVPGLRLAAGGQVIEQAEGFNIGPATFVGVIAAMVIMLITFGSLTAAGMPLVTAGFGLLTGIGLIGLATHVTDMSNIAPQLALMIGLGVGIDYALFIVTRFRESYAVLGDVEASVVQAMDTSGRAILLAGTTVIIALLGMFATGVPFMYGLSIASVMAVLFTLLASLTVLPAMLSRFGTRVARRRRGRRGRRQSDTDGAGHALENGGESRDERDLHQSRWRAWSRMVQARPWPLAGASLAFMVLLLLPVFGMRLQSSDAGNDPASTSTRQAYDMLASGFGAGFNGPLLVVSELTNPSQARVLPALRAQLSTRPDVVVVTPPRIAPSGKTAVIQVYPGSAPQDSATNSLVNDLRHNVAPGFHTRTGVTMLVGGFTAGSIDFSHVLSSKLPLFIGIVICLSALLLLLIFRSLLIPVQAAAMNLLSIGGALGLTVLVFEKGWLGGLLGLQKGPVEPWIPVLMFAVVFGLSMDYEVFLVSRVREEWVRRRDASEAVANGIAYTGRVISAAAAIMVCVFLSFMLPNERTIKEFGFGLAIAVFLDAIVVRCIMLPAVLEILGRATWWFPRRLGELLPDINIEGHSAREEGLDRAEPGRPLEPVG
jgi:RND superfamily putative drug exporter